MTVPSGYSTTVTPEAGSPTSLARPAATIRPSSISTAPPETGAAPSPSSSRPALMYSASPVPTLATFAPFPCAGAIVA